MAFQRDLATRCDDLIPLSRRIEASGANQSRAFEIPTHCFARVIPIWGKLCVAHDHAVSSSAVRINLVRCILVTENVPIRIKHAALTVLDDDSWTRRRER